MKTIRLSSSSRKFLLKADKYISSRITNKIKTLAENSGSLEIKKLKGEQGLFRIRVGDYRIIFEVHDDTILITKIGSRKDVYK